MNDWLNRAAALARRVADAPGVDPQWAEAFAEVPRHVFVPRFHPGPDPSSILDASDPGQREQWLNAVYADESLVTQYALTPGTTDLWQSTSSSTRPSLMARMLTLLDVHDGQRILEVGTGTGYNAALLCRRVGDELVSSVDIDPTLIQAARAKLGGFGLHPALATRDGASGWPEHATYDRIVATCAVPAIPPSWIAQLRPDGLIVTDVRGELLSSLLVARANGDGTVSGRFLAEPGHFMWLRADARNPLRDGGQMATCIDYDDARSRATPIDPAVLDAPGLRLLIQLTAPGVNQIWTSTRDGRHLVRVSGRHNSWAELHPATNTVTQGGPDNLFDHIEHAVELWDRLGHPAPGQVGITAGPRGQTIWLDSPANPVAAAKRVSR
ncbi:MAG: methyltransferase domain-containing protein [Actinomycetota bacterium]|nr:methyltransferase domain-containing protein [Actinomycetota bacterium]